MGGTVDPRTGEIIWKMHVPIADQLAFYQAHPPTTLEGLLLEGIALPDHTFDGHGEPVNAVFEVRCPCGGARFVAVGFFSEGEGPMPPITLDCDGCEAVHLVFDENHGYDGVISALDTSQELPYPDGIPDELCWDGLEPPYSVIVRFEYPSDHLGDSQWSGREPDLFSWITLLGRDPAGGLVTLFDEECA